MMCSRATVQIYIISFAFSCVCSISYPSFSYAVFSFAIVSDQRLFAGPGVYDNSNYFSGAVIALNKIGAGAFIISPGDIDPPAYSKWTIENILGTEYQWFPVVGNHELPGQGVESYHGSNLEWLRQYSYDINGTGNEPDIVNQGPPGCFETTFSFDYENVHFVIVNEYCDIDGDHSTDGDISDHLYNWLVNDLFLTSKEHVFVFGHKPAYPQPDADNGRERHMTDSLNAYPVNRDRFWSLLGDSRVIAYFCGHTHNYSAMKINGVWQVDSGHARGAGDTGAPSTLLKVTVDGARVKLVAYRDVHDGVYDYTDIVHNITLRDYATPAIISIQSILLLNSQ